MMTLEGRHERRVHGGGLQIQIWDEMHVCRPDMSDNIKDGLKEHATRQDAYDTNVRALLFHLGEILRTFETDCGE